MGFTIDAYLKRQEKAGKWVIYQTVDRHGNRESATPEPPDHPLPECFDADDDLARDVWELDADGDLCGFTATGIQFFILGVDPPKDALGSVLYYGEHETPKVLAGPSRLLGYTYDTGGNSDVIAWGTLPEGLLRDWYFEERDPPEGVHRFEDEGLGSYPWKVAMWTCRPEDYDRLTHPHRSRTVEKPTPKLSWKAAAENRRLLRGAGDLLMECETEDAVLLTARDRFSGGYGWEVQRGGAVVAIGRARTRRAAQASAEYVATLDADRLARFNWGQAFFG